MSTTKTTPDIAGDITARIVTLMETRPDIVVRTNRKYSGGFRTVEFTVPYKDRDAYEPLRDLVWASPDKVAKNRDRAPYTYERQTMKGVPDHADEVATRLADYERITERIDAIYVEARAAIEALGGGMYPAEDSDGYVHPPSPNIPEDWFVHETIEQPGEVSVEVYPKSDLCRAMLPFFRNHEVKVSSDGVVEAVPTTRVV